MNKKISNSIFQISNYSIENLCKMSLRGPKGRGNLLPDEQKKPSLSLRLLRFARNDGLWADVFNKAKSLVIEI